MKKRIWLIISLLLLIVEFTPAIAQIRRKPISDYWQDGISYRWNAGGAEVIYCDPELRAVSIPSEVNGRKVTRIGEMAFQYSDLVSVVLPESITVIDSMAFFGCDNLSSINFPAGLTRIGKKAFQACTSLKSISLSDSLTEMRDGVFRGCKALASVRLPAGLESIGISSFEGCEELTSIVLPSSVRRIGPRAYYGCPIKELYVGGNLEPGALADLHWLTDATLGSQVTDASSVRWSDCDSLATLRVLATTPPAAGEFSNKQYMNVEVRVPEGTLALYQAADGWKNFWNLQESSFTGISVAGAAATFRIRADGGHIVVEQAKGPVSVYDMAGRLVGRATADGGRAELAVPDGGTYIVKAGDTAVKIAL